MQLFVCRWRDSDSLGSQWAQTAVCCGVTPQIRPPWALLTLALLWATTGACQAGAIVPVGLHPGDRYHLAFVTHGVRDVVSADITNYNAFAQSEASLNPALTGTDMGVDWFAIGSTATVNARDNALVGNNVPVYLIDGTTLIASGFGDFWDETLSNPISLNQFQAAPAQDEVWTGTFPGGFGDPDLSFGAPVHVSVLGLRTANNSQWYNAVARIYTEPRPIYALSEELTAPEPGCLAGLTGLAVVAVAYRRRRRRARRP